MRFPLAALIVFVMACGDDEREPSNSADTGDATSEDGAGDAIEDGVDDSADTTPDVEDATTDAVTDLAEGDTGSDAAPDQQEGDVPGDATSDSVGGDPDAVADVLADTLGDAPDATSVPLVSDVLGCGSPGGAGGLNRGDELQRHNVDLEAYPDALCNDGTGAVFYFRPHEGEENTDRWVIQLQGGGGCRSGDSCAARWCSVDTNFGMTQMTADLAPDGGINGAGILNRREANPFGDWNQVFLRYCSSDSWGGTARDVVLDGVHPRRDEAIEYRVHFLGNRIVDAVLGTIRADLVDGLEYTIGAGSVDLPDLDDAAVVVLAGASAGGGGATVNADRVGEILRENNSACDDDDCPLQYRVLIDSHFGPSTENYDFSATAFCSDHELCDYEAHQAASHIGTVTNRGSASDASCLAYHAEAGDSYVCSNDAHVIQNHITTPMFIRMGQTDSLISGNHIDTGFRVDDEALDLPTFARLVREQLEAAAGAHETAEEADLIDVAPAVYGPTCAKHETLRNNAATFNVTIDVDGDDLAMLDVFMNWVTEDGPRIAIAQSLDDNVCP